ncbi:TonB-dependent receptor domain-containing protein [Sphingomonas bacterium]|uniref:TonB-dependent receptor domain-containing protein n=1 Tax=Sphingomonas bacterium TaxID=1895847 RepID=UPI0015764875|nr:TonB-dependent receptor [Sphingomonas bacterium]
MNVVNSPNHAKASFVPFKVGFEGQLTPDILVYGNYATAYKDPAINLAALQATPVRTERVRSFEAGAKTSFLNHRLQINAAIFHSIYNDLQLSQLIGTVATLVNAPKAEINGAEAEIVATPATGLQLRANIGYLDPKIRQFSNGATIPGPVAGPLQNLAGKQLPNVAKVSLNLGIDYKFEPIDGYVARLGGEYSYKSRIYFNEFNTALISQTPVGLFNATASFGPASERFKAFFYINNITDRTVQTGVNVFTGLVGASRAVNYLPRRSFGTGLSFSF